jgi:hydrogenase maturation protease
MGDDGVAHVVAEGLERTPMPEGVRITRGDTDALRLPSLWRGEGEVWVVDAVRSGQLPGTVVRLQHEALLAAGQAHRHAHALSLPECLRWIALACPEMAHVRYRFWGIEVATVAPGEGLSPTVVAAAARVIREIGTEIERRRPGRC